MSTFRTVVYSASAAMVIAAITYDFYRAPSAAVAESQYSTLVQGFDTTDVYLGGAVTVLGLMASNRKNLLQSPYQQQMSAPVGGRVRAADHVVCTIEIGIALTREKQCRRVTTPTVAMVAEQQ